jgi:endonuclease/exonuclease/phosphatase family metal-dependent hydrolase
MTEIAAIVDGYQKLYGKDVPIVVGGDFNVDVRTAPEVQPIRDRLRDPFDLKGVSGDERVTHTYHASKSPAAYTQLDALFVTPSLAGDVIDIEAYRYKDLNGKAKPLPNTYQERSRNPSDHFPIVVTLSTEDIFPEAFKKASGN